MARRKRNSGLGIAVPRRMGGYPRHSSPYGTATLTDFNGKTIGHGRVVNCTKIRPGTRASWLSNYRCSYQFEIRGMPYACRGFGDGIFASCRAMKKSVSR